MTTATDELAAMRRIVATLDKLDPDARLRAVVWLYERYGGGDGAGTEFLRRAMTTEETP